MLHCTFIHKWQKTLDGYHVQSMKCNCIHNSYECAETMQFNCMHNMRLAVCDLQFGHSGCSVLGFHFQLNSLCSAFAFDCVNFLAFYVLDTKETFLFSHVFVFFCKFCVKNMYFTTPSLVILCGKNLVYCLYFVMFYRTQLVHNYNRYVYLSAK